MAASQAHQPYLLDPSVMSLEIPFVCVLWKRPTIHSSQKPVAALLLVRAVAHAAENVILGRATSTTGEAIPVGPSADAVEVTCPHVYGS